MPPLKNPVILDKPLTAFYEGWGSTPPWGIVVHYSAGYNALGCMEVLKQRGLSAHCSIERDGTIWKHLSDEDRGIHAGYGRWAGISNMNHHMFGYEVINFGPVEGKYTGDQGNTVGVYDPRKYSDPNSPTYDATVVEVAPDEKGRSWYRDETYNSGKSYSRIVTTQTAKNYPDHRDNPPGVLWPKYPRRQMRAVLWQTWEWIKAHEILPEMIVGHEHVTPHKKTDPGPAFGWKWLTGELEILYRVELPHLLDYSVRNKERVKSLQSHLDRMNLPVGAIDGAWGKNTENATKIAIGNYSDVYTLDLTESDATVKNVTKLCFAFLNVLGEDPGRN